MTITYNSTNYFLLPCQDGFMLIDAGWNGKLERFKKELASFNMGLNDIKFILLTHHHHDHSALVQDLKDLTKAKLIIHKSQVNYLTKGITDYKKVRQYNWFLWILDKVLRPMIKYDYRPIKIETSDFISGSDIDDKILRKIGVKGKIVTTPGHSSDSVSVLLDNGIAYIGDLAMSIMRLVSRIPLPIEAENYEQVKESMKKLINLGANEFYPSHGEAISRKMIEQVIK